jgi:hypothetical protein
MDNDIVFVDSKSEHFFWILELEDHVHNSRNGKCVKNNFGPQCFNTRKTILDKALDWVAKRL